MSESTPEHILDVAARLFTERGFANVSIRNICDEAGVTPPTIYHHFENKDGLFQAVVQRMMRLEDFRAALSAAIDEHDDPEAQLRAFIDTYLSSFPTIVLNPGLFYQNSTDMYELSAARFSEEFDAICAMVRRILADGVETGVFRSVDVDTATQCLLGMLGGFITNETYLQRSYRPEKAGSVVFDLALNGLRRDE